MQSIQDIANTIEKAGGKLYLVGGALRDRILNKPVFDEDYCLCGIDKEKFLKLFPKAHCRGKSFEVFDLDGKEIALARKDFKTNLGHKGFKIVTGKEISIEEDLRRRDITINSIAQDVLTGEIIDPFKGLKDLQEGRIRATSNKFKEDPLRVYRVARISANLEFEVDERTIKLMNNLKDELLSLSKERIFNEFRKALKSYKPSIFFQVLKKADVLDIHYKEIYDLIGSIQPIEHHPEGDSFNHTMNALDNSAILTDNIEIRFSTLVHDLGKGVTPKELYPHHYGHEESGVPLVKSLGNRIGVPKSWIKCGVVSCREHMRGGKFYKMSIKKQVDFLERIKNSLLGIKGLQIVVYSDRSRYIINKNNLEEKYNFENIGYKLFDHINSEYIKQKYPKIEGKEFGEKLHLERIKWLKEYYIDK